MSYQKFLTVDYSHFQSFFPGGLNYDYTADMLIRVVEVHNAARVLLAKAAALDLTDFGMSRKGYRIDVVDFIARFVNKGCFRNDRKKWKNQCVLLGIREQAEPWRREIVYSDMYQWAAFREALHTYTACIKSQRDKNKVQGTVSL